MIAGGFCHLGGPRCVWIRRLHFGSLVWSDHDGRQIKPKVDDDGNFLSAEYL